MKDYTQCVGEYFHLQKQESKEKEASLTFSVEETVLYPSNNYGIFETLYAII
jgi:hypothetical protein